MARNLKSVVASFMAMTIVVSSWSTLSFASEKSDTYSNFDMNDWYVTEAPYDAVKSTPTPFSVTDEDFTQLTEADIQEMSNDNAYFVYNEDGYATTIIGTLYETPVHTFADLRVVIGQLSDLLGISGSGEIEPLVMTTKNDYITFTFRQLDGEFEVANSTLKLLIDENNIPIMIQSSLVADLHTSYRGTEIEAEDAELVVTSLGEASGVSLTVFSDYTSRCVLNDAQIASTRCYRIYTDNPFASDGADMPYLVHYVDFDGNYLKNYPTNNLVEENLDEHDNDEYFRNLRATNYTFTVDRNGEPFTFSVPVSYNSRDHKYYLADPSRKIILADFYTFVYRGNLTFEKSDDPEEWDENHLITYYNYIQSYDYYKYNHGQFSADGFGIPTLILTEWCDSQHTPVNNQCSMGIINGWSVFGTSSANTYGYSMDVTAHEFTHAVTSFTRQGNLYYNEYGAINEGFSDIMGNIAEMVMGETDDLTWALGETSGNTIRSMSDPTLYGQPLAVGDEYYSNTIALPNSAASGISDNGGVHSNDSLFSHLAYVLYEEGMSLDDMGALFFQAMVLHTPKADYDDLYAILIASAGICGLEEYMVVIDQYWTDAGMKGDRFETVRSTVSDGYARFNLVINPVECAVSALLMVHNVDTNETYYATAMEDGTFSICVPGDAEYQIALEAFTDPSFSEMAGILYYSPTINGWTDDSSRAGILDVEANTITPLQTITAR